ncbi:PAS and helix-turn-helix domain-containing protein [Bordetella genomosp. 9]|uniref:Helix-turn-helix transcriptional regulator n=1 Tax=Bordetella genomosp. 9 TaxID=1416803 RepID=A0A1W6Z3R3_9BORD|nr:PAS and helix-turn-helix domain-containing protein [Bordetella genomosp. 9]ARP88045.1 helix-turn-helix transcriptional regulator [Bordetella genomosp. 9]
MSKRPDIDYRQAFMLAPIGMCVSNRRVMRRANAALEAMFRCGAGALDGVSFEALYPTTREFEHAGVRFAPVLSETGRYADERIMKRLDGELFWCRVTGRTLTPDDPHAAGIWTFEDLSSLRPVAIGLSVREREIATLIAEGRTSKEIARQLGLSHRTVETYRARLMTKFSAATSSSLIHKLMRPQGN